MKLSKIASLCKKSKYICCMLQDGVGLWIGDGEAMYLMPELTTLDEDGIYTVLGINQKQREKIIFQWVNSESALMELNFNDFDDKEIPATKSLSSINYKCEDYTLVTSEIGAEVNEIFDRTYLQPTSDMPEASIYIRYSKINRRPYIAVKNGMEIQAVVLCYITVPDFTDEISKLLTLTIQKHKSEAGKYEQTTFNEASD